MNFFGLLHLHHSAMLQNTAAGTGRSVINLEKTGATCH